MFPLVRHAVASLIGLSQLRWIGFSHAESDECGSQPEWLAAASGAQPLCSQISARVNRDFSSSVKAARRMADGELPETGKYRFRFCRTAQLPHAWDAGLLFEETTRSLLCSDLPHHNGNCTAVAEDDWTERCRQAMLEHQTGMLADYVPYSHRTAQNMHRPAALEPLTLAAMHGSTFTGDGAQALRDLDIVLRGVFGPPAESRLIHLRSRPGTVRRRAPAPPNCRVMPAERH